MFNFLKRNKIIKYSKSTARCNPQMVDDYFKKEIKKIEKQISAIEEEYKEETMISFVKYDNILIKNKNPMARQSCDKIGYSYYNTFIVPETDLVYFYNEGGGEEIKIHIKELEKMLHAYKIENSEKLLKYNIEKEALLCEKNKLEDEYKFFYKKFM